MSDRTIRLHASPAPARLTSNWAGTFVGTPIPIEIPAGTTGLTKVTDRDHEGPGTFLGIEVPPTAESARRRLELPPGNRATEVRTYTARSTLYAIAGAVRGSTTGELQLEVLNPESLVEDSRWRMPFDFELRFASALK